MGVVFKGDDKAGCGLEGDFVSDGAADVVAPCSAALDGFVGIEALEDFDALGGAVVEV